jgi:RNA polymerase sigma factor (sigma-70 family)
VDTTSRDLARAIWRQIAARHQWQLFAEEEVLLDLVQAVFVGDATPGPSAESLRAALFRVYSERLYRGLRDREERAAYELWLMLLRLAMRDGVTSHEADDLAQEAMARVLAKLNQVQSPERLLAWAMMVFRTVQRDLRAKHPEQSLTVQDEQPTAEPVDPSDLVAEVEDRLVAQEFRDLLRAALPNDLERLTLLRCIVFGDDPRDVARDLGLPLHRTRVAKSRALQRLRSNDRVMAFIHALTGGHADE